MVSRCQSVSLPRYDVKPFLRWVGLQGPVYKVLVVLVKNMNLPLVVHLIGRLQEAVDGDGDWGGLNDVLTFLGYLATDEDHVVIAR